MSSAATVWIPLAVSAATQAAATAPGESLRRMVSAPHCGHVRCPVDRLRPPWGGFQRSLLPVAELGLLAHVVEQVAARRDLVQRTREERHDPKQRDRTVVIEIEDRDAARQGLHPVSARVVPREGGLAGWRGS